MEWTTGPEMEEERRAPARAHGAENGGGAAGPPPLKVKNRMFYQKITKLIVFPCCRTLGQAMRQKACRLALAEAPSLFSLSYCVGKTINSVNVCLECPVFNASGAAVCRPQCLARC